MLSLASNKYTGYILWLTSANGNVYSIDFESIIKTVWLAIIADMTC